MARRRRSDGFQSFSIIEFLTRPFGAVLRLFGGLRGDDHSMRHESSALQFVLAPFTFPFRLIWGMGVFMVMSWASSRNFKAFLIGFPAIICVLGVLGSNWLANFLEEKRSVGASLAYLKMHLDRPESDPEDVKMFAEKLVKLKPDDLSFKYKLALSHIRDENLPAAMDVMQYITSGERSYPDAHVWMAKHYLNPQTVELTAEERDEVVQRNLKMALEQAPDSQEALFTQANFHIAKALESGADSVDYDAQLELAVENLQKVLTGPISGTQLQAIVSLIQILLELERGDQAKNVIDNVMKNVMPLAKKNADISVLWFTLVKCAVQLKDYELADQIIFDGLQFASDDQVRIQLQQLSAEVTLSEVENLKIDDSLKSFQERMNLLCEAITENPKNHRIYLKFIETVFIQEKDSQKLRQSTVERSRNPAIIHILIGIVDLNEGNVPEGQKHWRIAEQQYPDTPMIIYNFLDILNRLDSEPIKNLGNVISLAIEIFPDHVLMYNIRSFYFQKRDQLEEALEDLQHIEKVIPDQLVIKKRIALLNRQLGKIDLALEQEAAISQALRALTPKEQREHEAIFSQLK